MSNWNSDSGGGGEWNTLVGILEQWYAVVAANPWTILLLSVPAAFLSTANRLFVRHYTELLSFASFYLTESGVVAFTPRTPFFAALVVTVGAVGVSSLTVGVALLVRRYDATVTDLQTTWSDDFVVAVRRAPRTAGYLLLSGFAVAVGSLLLVLPGLYAGTRLVAGLAPVVTDGRSVRGGVRWSLRATEGRVLVTAVCLLVLVGVYVLLTRIPVVGYPLAVSALGAGVAALGVTVARVE